MCKVLLLWLVLGRSNSQLITALGYEFKNELWCSRLVCICKMVWRCQAHWSGSALLYFVYHSYPGKNTKYLNTLSKKTKTFTIRQKVTSQLWRSSRRTLVTFLIQVLFHSFLLTEVVHMHLDDISTSLQEAILTPCVARKQCIRLQKQQSPHNYGALNCLFVKKAQMLPS